MNHRITTKTLKYLVFLLMLSGMIILTDSILGPDTQFIYPPFHSAIEAMGAMAAILTAYLINFSEKRRSHTTIFISAGLYSMGILDLFHSFVGPSKNFVWLHSIATLSGGLFFVSTWLPRRFTEKRKVRYLPEVALIISALFGILSLGETDLIPKMIDASGDFSTTAKAINFIGGLFFITASFFFFIHHFNQSGKHHFLFANHCLLFGIAGIIFDFSKLWDFEWWLWHLFRLIAYLVATYYCFSLYREKDRVLTNKEMNLREAQNLAHIGSWEWNIMTNHEEWSDEQFHIFGYQPGEVIPTYDLFLDAIHPEDKKRVLSHIENAINDNEPYNLTFKIMTPDCKIKHIHAKGKVIRNRKNQPVKMVGTVQDISERKTLEHQLKKFGETQTELLREVNHRVKNNLTSIISMLHKEIDRSENTGTLCPIPVLEELEKRITSLLTVHTMLSESSWQPLILSELCRKIFDSVLKGTSSGDRVTLEKMADPIRIGSNQAHALALVINEVATNFVKHARSKEQQPAVHITLLEKNGLISLEFHDNGPGFPKTFLSNPSRDGAIGFELIRGIVEKNLEGEVNINNDNGAILIITINSERENVQRNRY